MIVRYLFIVVTVILSLLYFVTREFGIMRQPAIFWLCRYNSATAPEIPSCVLEVEDTNRLQPPVIVPVEKEGR